MQVSISDSSVLNDCKRSVHPALSGAASGLDCSGIRYSCWISRSTVDRRIREEIRQGKHARFSTGSLIAVATNFSKNLFAIARDATSSKYFLANFGTQ
jgi:hypothetical protein